MKPTQSLPPFERLLVRWTVGDVSLPGFEALRYSILGAWRLFGPAAAYAVCVNSIPVETARERTGAVPGQVEWLRADGFPGWLRPHFDAAMAEGVAWKFAPLRLAGERFELALDNDCILWALPPAVRLWLEDGTRCLIAEDVRPCLGCFSERCGPLPRNSGIRGLPPGFDLEGAFRRLLREGGQPRLLASETDEQGLQVAATRLDGEPHLVELGDVTICSPFPPHLPHLGRCGAHFVGLNTKKSPWSLDGRPAAEHLAAHWRRCREAVAAWVEGD